MLRILESDIEVFGSPIWTAKRRKAGKASCSTKRFAIVLALQIAPGL
jgi:hypothetical protein